MEIGYNYIIWNPKTRMFYSGSKKGLPEETKDYYGSPSAESDETNLEYQRLLREEKHKLKKRVLFVGDYMTEVLPNEVAQHKKWDVKNNLRFYNANNQSSAGFICTGHTHKTRTKMSETHKKIGTKPPCPSKWWDVEHAKKHSERMKGNQYRKGKKDTEETKRRKRESFAKSDLHAAHLKVNVEERIAKMKVSRKGKGCGERNAMANPEARAKVSKSKKGLKGLYKEGKRKMAKPGSDKWNTLIKEGYKVNGN